MNKKQLFLVMFLTVVNSQGSDQVEQKKLEFWENTGVGAVAGAAEILLPGQILSYKMNTAINKIPFIWRNSYKGLMPNILGSAPIMASQKLTQAYSQQIVEQSCGKELSDAQKIGVSIVAGIVGSVIDTPCNAVQLYMQEQRNAHKSMLTAMQELGAKKSFRGFVPNALMKEAPFVVGYQFLSPKGKHVMQQHVADENVAAVIGGVAAGVAVAVVTHPGAVLRNMLQSDLRGIKYKTTWQTMKSVYTRRGVIGFFDGLQARGVRVAIAVPLLDFYMTKLESMIKNRS